MTDPDLETWLQLARLAFNAARMAADAWSWWRARRRTVLNRCARPR